MAFKPNRDLLNVNFEGYTLGKDALPYASREFASGVKVARLKDEQFSYQHMRAFTLHNHLVLDPWSNSDVYWYAGDGTIQRAHYEGVSGALTVQPVYVAKLPQETSDCVNASIIIFNSSLCLFSDGQGSLQLLFRPRSTAATPSEWTLLENVTLADLEDAPFMILAARVCTRDNHQLNVATLELKDASKLSQTAADSQPVVAIYRWHRLKFAFGIEKENPQFGDDDASGSRVLVQETQLCCSFQSHTSSLYCSFTDHHLLIISESDILPVDTQNQQPVGNQAAATTHVEALECEEEEKQKHHYGLGYSTEKAYRWAQSDADITITVNLPGDITKHDITCVIKSSEVVLGLTDGTTYLRGTLYAPVDPDASAWSIENNLLEVTLEKMQSGQWPSLIKGEEEGTPLPLGEGLSHEHLSKEELQELERKIAEVSQQSSASKQSPQKEDEEGPSSPKKPRRLVQTPLEECDTTEEDATLFVLNDDGSLAKRAGLGGHQLLFTAPSAAGNPDVFCLRYDVDAVVWQPDPMAPGEPTWYHKDTFNALGYVQAAKEDKKFSVCPPNRSFATICDCKRHVFVYKQPPEGIMGNDALQFVHTLSTSTDILGLQATDAGFVFVLTEKEVTIIVVK